MTPRDVLGRLRDGRPLSAAAVNDFAIGLGNGQVSDAQAGAFAMAVCLRGLTPDARVALTEGMRDSGQVLDWQTDRKVIDKHSTGGVGDAVSLMLAPWLASIGAVVPMISGRGLGHTGGTLDKLDAIPGFKTNMSMSRFRRVVQELGCAIVAPTPDLAPADRKLYGVRDVTGTVRSVDLITASILAKKLAAGLDALVLDVKVGAGAVMQDADDAYTLAQSLVNVANGAGCPTTALITDMDQPLLPAIGNAVEVAAVMQAFTQKSGRLVDVALELGTVLLKSAHMFYTEKGAREALEASLQSGDALTYFGAMINAQGGPENFADRWEDYLNIAPGHLVRAKSSGFVTAIDGTALGHLVVGLGGGRQHETDRIDYSVGLSDMVPLGAQIKAGQVLAVLHATTADAARQVAACFTITDAPVAAKPLIQDRITG
ncbi:MAG: thymidine phosphorylase [Planktomarina sp.]